MSEQPIREFGSARLKIERAPRHIQELDTAIQAFLQTDFCQLVVEDDPNTGHQLIKASSVSAPPTEISLIIGDAVHNLRSALDYAMVQISGKTGNQVAFPMAKDRNNPGSHPAYGLIKKTKPDLAALLTDTIGIHDTGDLCLWSISALDNADKHNLLIAVLSIHELHNICLEDKARNNRFTNLTARMEAGRTVNMIAYSGGRLEVTNKGQPAAAVLFAQGQPLEGKPIVPSLNKLAEMTLQAIQTLEAFVV